MIVPADQLHGKGRLFARQLLKPGSSIGRHPHTGDCEVYYIISGKASLMIMVQLCQMLVEKFDALF